MRKRDRLARQKTPRLGTHESGGLFVDTTDEAPVSPPPAGEYESPPSRHTFSSVSVGEPPINRFEETTQQAEKETVSPISLETQRQLEKQTPHGVPLEPTTRSDMESTLGADFSSVRLHDDASAATITREVRARAFTQGSDIFLGSEVDLASDRGQATLAHELTH